MSIVIKIIGALLVSSPFIAVIIMMRGEKILWRIIGKVFGASALIVAVVYAGAYLLVYG